MSSAIRTYVRMLVHVYIRTYVCTHTYIHIQSLATYVGNENDGRLLLINILAKHSSETCPTMCRLVVKVGGVDSQINSSIKVTKYVRTYVGLYVHIS